MKNSKIRGIALSLVIVWMLGLIVPASAIDQAELQSKVNVSAAYLYKTVSNPQVGSIGGEWAVLGLARSGFNIPDVYYENYYATIENYVAACQGVLHEKKYTEYSRLVVALTSIGKDPTNVAGYNLLTPLGDFDKTIWQGINGPIWALIALDSGNYTMPQNPEAVTQATRQMYVSEILSRQLNDGGWNLSDKGGSSKADPDITGMALQALAKYQAQEPVKKTTEKALDCLSKMQDSSGGFASWGTTNSESTVQVIVALCELGIPLDDSRFVKNGHTLLENLISYCTPDGSFLHTASGSGSNQMASEQGFYGLVAAKRAALSQNSLYRMSDAITFKTGNGLKKGEGLPGKHKDVKAMPIIAPGTTYRDISTSSSITAIEALAARSIITGKGDGLFDPNANMTRAEFCTIVTRCLGLNEEHSPIFHDVPPTAWYAGFVGAANQFGIVNGVDSNNFNPNGIITRQEASTMVSRAAALCGMNTEVSVADVRDILAQFGDYVTIATWAQAPLAFCYQEGILDQSVLNVEPSKPIQRSEIAQMLFHMLTKSNLM